MPTVPVKYNPHGKNRTTDDNMRDFFNNENRIAVLFYDTDRPISGAAPIALTGGTRHEFPLYESSSATIPEAGDPLSRQGLYPAPVKGIIKRIIISQVTGGTATSFKAEIVNKPFGTGSPSDDINVIYKEDLATATPPTLTNKVFEIPYQVELGNPKQTLYLAITPVGGDAFYRARIYVIPKH